ncbi:hypothetical protein ACQPZG_17360 [Streptomyces sp. CA-294286]
MEILEADADADAATEALRATLGAPLVLGEGEVWRTALVPLGSGAA